jgi:hypothetical protein
VALLVAGEAECDQSFFHGDGGVTFVDICVSLSNSIFFPCVTLTEQWNLLGRIWNAILQRYQATRSFKESALYSEVPGLTYQSPSADLTMHTLFSSNILSPPPIVKPQRDPFELEFHSTTAPNSTASATSSSAHSSPTEYNLLTLRLQEERRTAEEYRHAEPAITRRKGHPKLLLMGQRR